MSLNQNVSNYSMFPSLLDFSGYNTYNNMRCIIWSNNFTAEREKKGDKEVKGVGGRDRKRERGQQKSVIIKAYECNKHLLE